MGNFPKFRPKNLKLSILTENWYTWHGGGADSKSRHRFLKLRPQNSFWANLGRKSQSCLFYLKIGTNGISRILILIPTLVFWISNPKSIFGQIWAKKVKVVYFDWKLAHRVSRRFWFLFRHYFSQFPSLNPFLANLGRKIQSCPFCLKIGKHGIPRMMILISTLVFWISKPKFIFGQNWAKKSQNCSFCLKIGAHTSTHPATDRPTHPHTYTHTHTEFLEHVDYYFDIF